MTGDRVDLDHLPGSIRNVLSDSRSENYRANQRRDASYHMNRAGAGVIMKAELTEPSAAPDPVRLDGIDQQTHHTGVYAVGGEPCPLRHSAGYNRRGGSAKNKVEHEIARVGKSVRRRSDELLKMEEQIEIRPSDQPEQRIFAHHQRISEE